MSTALQRTGLPSAGTPSYAFDSCDVAEAPAVPHHVRGGEVGRLARLVLVEYLLHVLTRELLLGLDLFCAGHGLLLPGLFA
jgi:hypothetical protein